MAKALIENYDDVTSAEKGSIPETDIRRIEVSNARVDTGATYISMPMRLINQLGLKRLKTVEARTTAGPVSFGIFAPVKLTIQGRDCEVRVAEVADSCPVLIGYIPLELLDFVVDPKNQRLIGNPDHGGEFMIDMY
ncbi:MAG: retroviral-like aspartic protease family protein [Isosphaeraceae bacterium]